MLIDPFNLADMEEDNFADDNNLIDVVIDELVEQQLNLITAYQDGKAEQSTLILEINKLVQEKGLAISKKDIFVKKVLDNLFGYGILQPYVDDLDITDILVNDDNTVFIKKFGKKISVPVSFGSEENLLKYMYKLAALNGGKLDESMNAETIISDKRRNMRIVLSIKPTSVLSPTICFRKHSRQYSLDQLVTFKMLEEEEKELLINAVKERKNIIIAGQGGSGKSTLLGALIDLIPLSERGLLIQETFEIQPNHPDIICKLVRQSDNDLIKNYTLFELTKIGLLMSLDRLIIGELKDKEAYDFFNAIFTGHEGSMTTVHAPSANQVIDRLLQLMSRAKSEIPYEALRNMLTNSLDMIVMMKEFKIKEIIVL